MSQVFYQLVDNVLFQRVANETVILEPETGEYYTLNAIGTFIIEQFQQKNSKEKVIDLVLENYQVEKSEVTQDIEDLLTQMIKQGLFVKVDHSHG
ncbi:MAG: PqqD family protein [Colwellia sp.]|nr:PqqD family protein [Colwellia sp.]